MVGPVDIVESGQVCALHNIVGNSVITVGAHDYAFITCGTGLGHHVRSDNIVVEGGVHQVNSCADHSGKLVGEVLNIHGCGGLGCRNLHAVLLAGGREGIVKALGVDVCGAVDNAHLFTAGLLGIGCGDGALEAVGVAGTEDVVILGGQGVGSGRGREQANLLLVGSVGNGGGAA